MSHSDLLEKIANLVKCWTF